MQIQFLELKQEVKSIEKSEHAISESLQEKIEVFDKFKQKDEDNITPSFNPSIGFQQKRLRR